MLCSLKCAPHPFVSLAIISLSAIILTSGQILDKLPTDVDPSSVVLSTSQIGSGGQERHLSAFAGVSVDRIGLS